MCPNPQVLLPPKLQALAYDIVPPTTAIMDNAIGLEDISEQTVCLSLMLKRQQQYSEI